MTRKRSLGLIGSALLFGGCGSNFDRIRVGCTNTTENAILAEVYAAALERARIPVARLLNLGDLEQVTASLERGNIDLFAGARNAQPPAGSTYLTASSAYDSACLVTSEYYAEKYWMIGMIECSRLAPQLRFAASQDFLAAGTLDRLRERYGGFRFKSVIPCDPGSQTSLVARGDAEVANAAATSPRLAEESLVILGDDKNFWPRRYITPLVRVAAMHRYPDIRPALDSISTRITEYALQQMNLRQALLDLEPRDVASNFVDRQFSATEVKQR
jgi:osmoprotectant transport system substrate-binding protein